MKRIKWFIKSVAYFAGKCCGFSDAYAVAHVKKLLLDYKNAGITSFFYVHKLHKRGFYLASAEELKLTDSNYQNYLNDFDYRRMHPINGPYSIWLDDKLTFRHVFSKYREHIPEYYFHIDENGNVLDCVDLPEKYRSKQNKAEVFLELLREKGQLFAKPRTGTLSNGVLTMAYQNGRYYINQAEKTREQVTDMLPELKDYIIQERIRPCKKIASCFTTIRIMVIHESGEDVMIPFTYIYTTDPEVPSSEINLETGSYLVPGSEEHWIVPKWAEIMKTVKMLAEDFPELCYMGIDWGLSDDNYYMYEINSLSRIQDGLPYMAEGCPLKPFFEKRLREMGRL